MTRKDDYRQSWRHKRWMNDRLKGTKYNSRGQKEIDFVKLWEINTWYETEQTLYKYDDGQYKITQSSQKKINGEWVIQTKVHYKLDKELNEEREAIQSFVDNELISVQHKRTQYYYENTNVNSDVIATANQIGKCPRDRK